jgi:hypothetical protein
MPFVSTPIPEYSGRNYIRASVIKVEGGEEVERITLL